MKILIVGAGVLLAATAAPVLANGGGAGRSQHATGNAGFGYLDRQFVRAWFGFAHGKHYGWFRGRHWGWFKPHNPHWPHEPPMSP